MCKVIVPTFMLQFGWRKNAKDATDVIRPVMQFECPACGRCGLTHVTCDDARLAWRSLKFSLLSSRVLLLKRLGGAPWTCEKAPVSYPERKTVLEMSHDT